MFAKLKLHGVGILTLADLQREFSAWEIMEQLQEFIRFVSVHSLPLPLRLFLAEKPEKQGTADGQAQKKECSDTGDAGMGSRDTELKKAAYLNKEFWLDLLCWKQWPACADAQMLMRQFAKEALLVSLGAKEKGETPDQPGADPRGREERCAGLQAARMAVQEEYRLLRLTSKIAHIITSAQLEELPQTARLTLQLLAVCELAEVNALEFSFARELSGQSWYFVPQTAQESFAASAQRIPPQGLPAAASVLQTPPGQPDPWMAQAQLLRILTFPASGYLTLVSRSEPYRFWYHSARQLASGEKIRTVCVKARPGSNRYTSVQLELYEDQTGICVHCFRLLPGEYRYCNVAGGKMIKFLPTVSTGENLCLSRKDLSSPVISVLARGAQEWQLKEEGVSCFAAGTQETGFLYVQNGKLNTVFYKRARDYVTRMQLSTIISPVVEVTLDGGGFCILTQEGRIFSEKGRKEGQEAFPGAAVSHLVSAPPGRS